MELSRQSPSGIKLSFHIVGWLIFFFAPIILSPGRDIEAYFSEAPIITLYIEGLKDYVKIFLTTQDRPVLTRMNLKAIESKLPSSQFCRIHNSYIVSLSKITSTLKSQVFIKATSIPIGDKFAATFLQKYKSTH